MTPPRRLMNVGCSTLTRSDFHAIGRGNMELLIRVGGLRPSDNVLDVGCGVGRLAIPLTGFLSSDSVYHGFDIVQRSVDHCRKAITRRFPNFRFDHADIHNSHYNPGGTVLPHEFRFPCDDASFSFVFLISVFTHMQWPEVVRYLKEIRRVLVPAGRVFATYFLINPESESAIREGKTPYSFAYTRERSRVEVDDDPDGIVAFDEKLLRDAYEDIGLKIVTVRHGSWSCRETGIGLQDIIVAQRR
jgi:SAM-dependent methyltransferase